MRISITKGHVDDRIDIDRDDAELAGVITEAYCHVAPKTLAALVAR